MKGELKEAVERATRLAAAIHRNAEEHFKTDLPPVYEIMTGDAAAVETIIAALSQPEGPPAMGVEECDWPPGVPFTFYDDPGEHDPCYVVMPGGAMIPMNHHAGEGVDIARAKFIIAACNAALSPQPVPARGEEGVG